VKIFILPKNMKLNIKSRAAIAGFLILFCLLTSQNQLSAAHIVGGDITYTCISSTATEVTLQFTFTMYRDDTGGGAGFDDAAKFGVFRGLQNNWTYVTERATDPINETFIEIIEADPCVDVVTQVVIEKANYVFTVTLPIISENYMIAYQRCCRNDDITNLLNSGETGAAFTVEIFPAALQVCNNSPVFNQPPPNIICANFPVQYDNSATDPEGDQISYSFCTPKTAGGTDDGTNGTDEEGCNGVRPAPMNCRPPFQDVSFASGFSGTQPVTGNPALSINNTTGIVSGRPDLMGLYVLGVCVEERRMGQLFSIIRSDYQITVGICSNVVEIGGVTNDANENVFSPPQIHMSEDSLIINSCGDLTVDLGCTVCENNFPEADVAWELMVDGTMLTSDQFAFTAEFPNYQNYQGTFFFQQTDGSSGCNDTIPISITISPPTIPGFDLVYDTCGFDEIVIQNTSINLGGQPFDFEMFVNDQSIGVNEDVISYLPEEFGELRFEIVITDQNNCAYNVSETIDYFPTDNIDFEPSNFIACQPAAINFSDVLNLLTEDYDAIWDFGDGSPPVNDISPTHVYADTGTFAVSLELISPDGSCSQTENFGNWVEVRESPEANFSFTPENPSVFQKELEFTDLSVDAVSWNWDFGGAGTSLFQNPTFTFPDTGVYDIQLVVTHPSQCPDTMIQRIDISPEVRLFFPNAFTPNNDAKNDEFKPLGILFGIQDYDFSIWNRWGEKIFETDDINEGWNGEKNNTGEPAPDGVYIYHANYIGPRGEIEEFKGHVTLLR